MRKNSLRRNRIGEAGASLIEAALGLPAVLLVVFLTMHLSRYMSVKSAVERAANRAVTKAAVIPGLEDDSQSLDGRPKNETVIRTIEEFPINYLQRVYGSRWITGVEAELVLPPPVPTLKDALNANPISVTVRGSFNGVLPFMSSVEISATSHGYREPVFKSSLPGLVDCFGNRVTEPSAVDVRSCPCQGDPLAIDDGAGGCMCRYTEDGDGCGCPREGQTYQPDGPNGPGCYCPTCNRLGERPTTEGACGCECAGGSTRGDDGLCRCTSPLVFINQQCQCNPSACPGSLAQPDPENDCACVCQSPYSDHWEWNGNSCVCDLTCPEGQDLLQNNNGRCECVSCNADSEYQGDRPVGQRCQCRDREAVEARCHSQNKRYVRGRYGCGCAACPTNTVVNPETEQCECPANLCDGTPYERTSNCECRCSAAAGSSCHHTETLNSDSCTCDCPEGSERREVEDGQGGTLLVCSDPSCPDCVWIPDFDDWGEPG